MIEVCIPELVLDKTRLDIISRIGGTGKRLLFSGPVTQENPGNKRDGTTQYHSGKSQVVPNFETFPEKPL